jgi:hypothetical protein
MTADVSNDRYDEFFEPLSLALGHLAFAAMTLERAMLADLVQRRVFRDGAEEVFGRQLVTRLERKPAGVLLEALRELDYAPDLAAEIADVIDRRNHFVHHLFDDPEFIEAFAARDGIGLVVKRVEALVSDIHVVTMRLEPQVSAGAEAMFGRSPSELLQLLRETDPDDFGEGELRRQLEALRQIPDSLVSAPGSEEGAEDHPERDAVDLGGSPNPSPHRRGDFGQGDDPPDRSQNG